MVDQGYWTSLTGRSLSRRRLLAAGGAGLAAAALAGCGGRQPSAGLSGQASTTSQAGTPKPGGNVTVLTATNYPLDPQKVSAGAQRLIGGVYSRIFKFQTGTNPDTIVDHVEEPDLGLSAESPDAVTWTVKLRPDARFFNIAPVNGHAVEAEDVKASFTRALDPATASPNRGQLNMIDAAQITTPDKQTVVFKLNYQYSPFRSLLGSPAYSWILPREVLSGGYDPAKTVIGSGPFMFANIQPDVAYTYKRNPDWHLKPGPYVDTLTVAVIPDINQAYAQFAAGNLDELIITNAFDVPTVKQQNPKATFLKAASGLPLPLYFQMGDATTPFKDIRLRRAVSMAIDRDAVNKAVWNGQGSESVFVPVYMGKWALAVDKLDADSKQYYTYNPSEAKKLLAAAGQPNFAVRLANPFASQGNVPFAKTVEVINQSFNSLGLKSTIVNGDYNKDFVDSGHGWRQGFFDDDMIMFASSATYTEADDWLYSYFHSKSTSNQERLNDPTYDAMVDKERTLVNDDERVKAVYDIEKYIAQQLYAPSSVGSNSYVAIQPRVQNYCYSSSLGFATEAYAKLWLNG